MPPFMHELLKEHYTSSKHAWLIKGYRLLRVFCLQIHARAKCTMNEKFCILHETAGAE